jgi:hypothetical protein
MRTIPKTFSMLTFLEELEYSEAALAAEPDTTDLAEPCREAIQAWNAIFNADRAARRQVVRAEAVVSVRNQQLDELTTRFGGVLMVEAGQDRKSTFFRRFFPVAPSQFIRQSLRKQCERTRDGILQELGKLENKSPLKTFEAPLRLAMTRALEALDARAGVKAARASVTHDLDEWKDSVNQLRLTTYAGLLKLAADKGHGRGWADTFFRIDARGGAAQQGVEDVEEEATEGPATEPAPEAAPNPA